MEKILLFFSENAMARQFLYSSLLFVFTLILIRLTNHLLFKTIKDNTTYYIAKKRLYYLYMFIFFIMILIQWSETSIDLTLYVGFISAGVAFALREVFVNMVAWLIIISQKPFEVGDRIHVNGLTGDIVDLKLFHFVVIEVADKNAGEQSTGKVAHIPNHSIFLHPVHNANKGFKYVWNEIDVRLTLDSDFEKAKDICLAIANKHALHLTHEAKEEVVEASKKYMLHYNKLTPIVYVSVKEGYLHLSMRYLCDPRQVRTTENAMWIDLLKQMRDEVNVEMI